MPRLKRPKQIRMNMTMPPDLKDRLEALRDETNAESLSEVIRRSVGVYETICKERRDYPKIVLRSEDESKEKELVIV